MSSTPADGSREDQFVTVDGTEIHYSAWGEEDAPVVVCVHGFSRNGRDFDDLAATLSGEYGFRVLCPDVPGRGLSEWSDDPATDYTSEALAASIAGFCDELHLDGFRWVGTSMGGAMGIRVASGPLQGRIEKLVLNDIGPGPVEPQDEPGEGAERISSYLSNPPEVGTFRELEEYFTDIYGDNRVGSDMRHLTLHSARRTDEGNWTPNYDPDIVGTRFEEYEPRDLWDEWDAIVADTLVLRGAESDVLSEATFEAMVERRPETEVVEYPGVGHAPSLSPREQIETVAEFLAD